MRLSFSHIALVVANYVAALAKAAVIVVVARTADVEAVGVFALATAVASPIQLLSDMRLRHVVASDVQRQHTTLDYTLANALSTTAAFGVLVGAAAIALFLHQTLMAAFILAIAAGKAVESFSIIGQGEYLRSQQVGRLSVSVIARNISALIVLVGVATITTSAIWALWAYNATMAVFVVTLDRRWGAVAFGPKRDWRCRNSLLILRSSFGLGVAALTSSLNTTATRYVVAGVSGSVALGLYSSAEYLVAPLALAAVSVGQLILAPMGSAVSRADRGRFRRLLALGASALTIIGVSAVGVTLVAGDWLLGKLYGDGFGSADNTLAILLVWGTISSVAGLAGHAMTALRLVREQARIALIVLPITALAVIPLASVFGSEGAAIAMCVGALINLVLCARVVLPAIDTLPVVEKAM